MTSGKGLLRSNRGVTEPKFISVTINPGPGQYQTELSSFAKKSYHK